ncbi:MAG TPA: 50S ribosomal protein L9 [Candidatus Paceibacterota bacterium]|nr:50S ribosomal protein L9 [Candidatus Paceibacterota bacterium]
MKVIFLKDVGGVGQRGNVKDVSDGYALNYLIPNGLAQQATPDRIAAHEATQKQQKAAREKEQAALIAHIQNLEGKHLTIKSRATEKGGLFKALGASDIKKAIHDQLSAEVSLEAITLEKPFKEIGEYPLTIKMPGAEARLTLAIVKLD